MPCPILEAVVFDLDEVLTDTASLHQSAWQRLFDEVLRRYPSAAPFTEADYVRYVDGRRRTDGVAAVLASRGIELEPGDPDDLSDRETLAGLGRRKDDYYLMLLHDRGPRFFPSSVAVVRALRRQGVATAVVSGSRHCTEVLRAAGLTQLFDVQVDGIDAARQSLPGKPDPATFMALPHLAAQEFMITATNWSGELRVCTGLDARVANLNVRADRSRSLRASAYWSSVSMTIPPICEKHSRLVLPSTHSNDPVATSCSRQSAPSGVAKRTCIRR